METLKTKDLIFVFGNPIRKIESMAKEYNITVLGTNSPQNLINEIYTSNDVSRYFFVITDEQELFAVNSLLRRVVFKPEVEGAKEPCVFVLIQKKFYSKLDLGRNRVYVRQYDTIDEDLVNDLIINTTIHNQVQYYTAKGEKPPTTMSKEKMYRAGRILDSLQNSSLLEGIQSQFREMKENQDRLSVSKLLSLEVGGEPELKREESKTREAKIETQEFLKSKEKELKERLKKAKSKADVKEIMYAMLEIFNMRSDDLRETASLLVDKIIEEGTLAKERSELELQDIENCLISGDQREVDYLLEKRDLFVNKVRDIESQVMQRADTIKNVTIKYMKDLKQSSTEVLTGEHKEVLPTEKLLAFQELYKSNGKAIIERSTQLSKNMAVVINDLQGVIRKYSQIVDIDTSIIENQKRMVDTLSAQKVIEKVEYSNSLTAKINLLVSPTPNLGASTLARIFSNRWKSMLVLDFREIITNPKGFRVISYSEFMTSPISTLSGGYVKVNSELARVVEEEEEVGNRLQELEGGFESILIIVDKYMTVGVPFDLIQRIIYISDPSENNLIEVNRAMQMYEPLFNLNRKMFVLNKVTLNIKRNLKEKLVIANIDPTKTRVNTIMLNTELVDGDDSEYKVLSSNFNYF